MTKKDNKKEGDLILGSILGICFLILIYTFIVKPIFNSSSKYLNDKSDKKANCQTSYSVRSAKTEFAAKQAFDKCMNR